MASESKRSSDKDAPRLRWAILAMLFCATVLNYVDRQTLSVLVTEVQRDLNISDEGYARIVQYFLIAYTVAYLGAGWLTDRLGARLSLALMLGWWSVANMATGWVRTAGQLGFARLMLGLGEPGVYTAGPKAIATYFPASERGLAIGIYTAGAMVGATIAPPLIAFLALTYGWRAAFVVTGAAGLVWLVAWLSIYPRSNETRTKLINGVRWRDVLRDRSILALAVSRLIADPVWYFYLFWFPKYLINERGFTLIQVASLAWLVYLAADLGSIGGGWFSGRLIRRGVEPVRSRLIAMACGAAIAPIGATIGLSVSVGLTIALGATVAFAHLVFQANMGALIVDVYPRRSVATAMGLIAAGSGLGGIFSTQLVGRFASSGSYDQLFFLMAVLHPVACGIAWLALRKRSAVVETSADPS